MRMDIDITSFAWLVRQTDEIMYYGLVDFPPVFSYLSYKWLKKFEERERWTNFIALAGHLNWPHNNIITIIVNEPQKFDSSQGASKQSDLRAA